MTISFSLSFIDLLWIIPLVFYELFKSYLAVMKLRDVRDAGELDRWNTLLA